MRRISVNVGGLWRTLVELKEEATWWDLKTEIEKMTGIKQSFQIMMTGNEIYKRCELEEGDDAFCDWKTPNGDHPLHYAALTGNIEAIMSWLASGADINITNKCKHTPLMYACHNAKYMEKLLELGANVHAIDITGGTVLHYLAYVFGHDFEKTKTISKILIKAGCNPKATNNKNETFMEILKRYKYDEPALEEWMKDTILE
jgi:ankyrin repeat protein